MIAYFCAEFALSDDLPIYSGGLGVLAGDVIRQAADEDWPLIGIGLFYNQGYFIQEIDEVGRQQHEYVQTDPHKAGLTLLTDVNNRPLLIRVPYSSGQIMAQVWVKMVKNIRVYLLDTNIEDNPDHLRTITDHLYNPVPQIRIAQEMLLGIGGVKLLRALGYKPEIYHLNEGHSAFAIYELAWELQTTGELSFVEAMDLAKRRVVFTNHTIVAAGNDAFPRHLLGQQLATYAEEQDLPLDDMLDAGMDDESDDMFSMTILALNSSAIANTVSKIHNKVAQMVWPDYTFASVTNGVHLPTWVSPELYNLLGGQLTASSLAQQTDKALWQLHQKNKKKLLSLVAKETGVVMDDKVLTVVWARRFAAYKRPNLVLQDLACLKQLAGDKKLQLIFAGKAHPNDKLGQAIFAEISRLVRLHGLTDLVAVMPNYRMEMAKVLEMGADVWLNTPIRGQEASGTSGMKAGSNGALHISTSDGWMDEVNWTDIGWILPDDNTADELFELLKHEVLPAYEQTIDGQLEAWVDRMRRTMLISWQRFSAERMLREYREVLYQPTKREALTFE